MTPERTISISALWMKMAKFAEETQKKFENLHEEISRLQEVKDLQTKTSHTLQENLTKLSKATEEKNNRVNQVLEEIYNCKRDRRCLDQDMNQFLNVFQKIDPQRQGLVFGNTPHLQEDIKPDAPMQSKHRSPSKYQDGDNMTYSEKKALKQLPQATSWPQFSGVAEYDYIYGLLTDVPSIPDYRITARLNTEFQSNASIWHTEMKEIQGRRNLPWWMRQIIQKQSNNT
ncbi:hypothetical protein O181_001350 [Austropuccinia psidii MF-1]|uniref:Uncharacterized protein n=1 Tax=Austropuccinia psidii MF-1 TaxID=1389203 RepID=A0A9Q3GBR4_9BASI|nr:hypothetical protein [Austropuccinia psidii MF-1]